GPLSRRLVFGVEGTLLFGSGGKNLRRDVIVDSFDQGTSSRCTLGAGLGYAWRPDTIFSFDLAGGFINADHRRTEDATANLLEQQRLRRQYLSVHFAAQRDLSRNIFISASLLSLLQHRTINSVLFADRFG